jgi:hypothetical protein
MSLATLLDKPCLIVSRSDSGSFDAHGNEIPTETTVDTVCELQQQQRLEPATEGELSDTRWVLFLPDGTDIDTSDAVVVDGKVYELVGDPWDARSGSPDMWHIEASVRRTAGGEQGS